MTKPREMDRGRETEATAADREPEVRPELIKDLDVTGDDMEVAGGGCQNTYSHVQQ